MTTFSSLGNGNVVPDEMDVQIRPKFHSPDKYGILYCHGAGGLADQALSFQFNRVLSHLAEQGHQVLSCDLGGLATWANDTAMQRVASAKEFLHSHMGAPRTKIILVGASMGGLTAFAWASRNPGVVAGVIGMVPVSDVTDIHTNNRYSLRASIDAAYVGGWSESRYGPKSNPVTFSSKGLLDTVPLLLFPADSDEVVLPSTVQHLADNVPGSRLVMMAGDHNGWTVPLNEVDDFIGNLE